MDRKEGGREGERESGRAREMQDKPDARGKIQMIRDTCEKEGTYQGVLGLSMYVYAVCVQKH